jgi:hypothetical protein
MRRIVFLACAIALALALTVSQPARADRVTPPDVPSIIQVPVIISQKVGATVRFDIVREDGRRARIDVPVLDRRDQQLRRRR